MAEALALSLADAGERGETLAVVDAVRNTPLLTGGSGIALRFPTNFIVSGQATGAGVTQWSVDRPEASLVGVTRGPPRACRSA